MLEADCHGARIAINYVTRALKVFYVEALLRSRFSQLIQASQDCSPQCQQVLAEATSAYQNTVKDRLTECEFKGHLNQEINFTDPQLPSFIKKCNESENQKISDDRIYQYGTNFFGTNNPSVKGNKSKDISHVFSKTRFSQLMKTVANEEQSSSHSVRRYAYFENEIKNSIEAGRLFKQNYDLDKL